MNVNYNRFNSFLFLLFFFAFVVSCKKENSIMMFLQVCNVDVNNAEVKIKIINNGKSKITEYGICWNTEGNPTLLNLNMKAIKDSVGNQIKIKGLKTSTTYYVKVYAKSEDQISYSDQRSFTTKSIPYIGANACGGIVIYIYQAGEPNYVANETHGLVADKEDISTGIQWGCEGKIFTTNNNNLIGMGKSNTSHIIDVCTDENTAAQICNTHVSNNYDDWFLPSRDELNLFYLNRSIIGGFGDAFYWSSSEYSDIKTHMQYLTTGVQYYGGKRATGRVRAIREF
jgi:hypothetical protein